MFKVYLIGIGYRPLDRKARETVLNSGEILASDRLYEVFRGYPEFDAVKERIKVINNVDETISHIKSLKDDKQSTTITLLASGDPMFFGIGRRALREFGEEAVELLPDLSSMQVAFSRIKVPWDNAFLMSLHGGPDPAKRRRLEYEASDIPSLLGAHGKIAVLTDKTNNPSVIAREIISSGIPGIVMHVCEKLGYPDEKITSAPPVELAGMQFADPNLVILLRTEE